MQTPEQRVVEIEFDRFVDDGEVEDEIYEEYRVNTDYVHNLYGLCTSVGSDKLSIGIIAYRSISR
jgi:hypothetical protein